MEPFKNYVTCIVAFFTPFYYLPHFLNFTLTLTPSYSLNFTKKLQNERKEDLFVYGCFILSHYIKGVKETHLETQLNFYNNMLHKQPILTKWWNYNILAQILYSYFRYIGAYQCISFVDVLFYLLTVILSGTHEKPRRNKD